MAEQFDITTRQVNHGMQLIAAPSKSSLQLVNFVLTL
jgi:hypothetical protein